MNHTCGQIRQSCSRGSKMFPHAGRHSLEIELLSSKRQHPTQTGNTFRPSSTQLTSFQEVLIQHHCLQPTYGGMDLHGLQMIHQHGRHETSNQSLKTWKSKHHSSLLQLQWKTLPQDFQN